MEFNIKDDLDHFISSKLPNLIDLQCDKNPLKMPQALWLLTEEDQALCILSRLFIFAAALADKLYSKYDKTKKDDINYFRVISYGEWLRASAVNILMHLGPSNEVAMHKVSKPKGGLFSIVTAMQKFELLSIEFMSLVKIDLYDELDLSNFPKIFE